MNEEDLQQSGAEIPEPSSEATAKPVDTGVADTPEVVETDEEKNTRIQAEQVEANRKREEKRQTSIQKRMDELTADKYAERKRADELATQNARILALLEESKGKPSTPAAAGEPTREQFDNYEDFVTARAEFRAEAKATAAAQAAIEKFTTTQKTEQTQSTQAQEQARIEKTFLERRAAMEKTIPDYREVIEDWEPKLPDSVVGLIVKHPDGPLLSYHMAKNPALEAQFRAETDPDMQKILMGQVLATLKASAKTTTAPTPGKPVAGKPAASSDGAYTGDPEGYFAWAQKNLK